jgi:hypothetical protein
MGLFDFIEDEMARAKEQEPPAAVDREQVRQGAGFGDMPTATEVELLGPFDLTAPTRKFLPVVQELQVIEAKLKKHEPITTADEAEKINDTGVTAQRIVRALSADRLAFTKKYRDLVSGVGAIIKPGEVSAKNIKNRCGNLLAVWRNVEAARKAAAAAKEAQLHADLQREAQDRARALGVPAPDLPAPVLQETSTSMKSPAGGGSHGRVTRSPVLDDFAKVEERYLLPPAERIRWSLVREACKSGIPPAGFRIEEKESTVFKS